MTRVAAPNGRFQKSPLLRNIIPANRISPIARNILDYYPLPTVQGTATHNLPLPNATENAHYYTGVARIDHNFGDRHHVFVRVNTMERNSVALDQLHNLTTARAFEFQSRGGIIDDIYTLQPVASLVMNFHYGYGCFVRMLALLPAAHGFELAKPGFPR